MRFFLILLFFCFSISSYCQQAAVEWHVTAMETGDKQYDLVISGNVEKDWYVYGKEMKIEGLEQLQVIVDDRLVKKIGDQKVEGKLSSIFDSVFSVATFVYQQRVACHQSILLLDTNVSYLMITIKGYAGNGSEFLPFEETKRIVLDEQKTNVINDQIKKIDLLHPVSVCGESENSSKSLLQLFILGFIGGLIALLTPCVFPMIPVTVSYFTGKAKNKHEGLKNGLFYGGFILLIYLLASVPFHLLGNINPEIFNQISTNAWVNVFFFVVFILFALSFFGLFELRMPSFITNTAGSKSNVASLGGIFFMAVTLATVSFSCTGPILGSLLVGSLSSQGGAWQLSSGMGGFGAALALPFALFAMFPSWLTHLPKSGGWMVIVKKMLAFAELALAIKFLSNADLVEHWGLLKREVFIGLWVVIAAALSVYLLFSAWDIRKRMKLASSIFLFIGLLSACFAFYMLPGLRLNGNSRLALLSGFPPPQSYSIYNRDHNKQMKGVEADVLNDYEKALALSKKTGKPLLIDFTGWACVNCRKMEELVWTNPQVSALIQEKFILVSLYVDDRTALPAAKRSIVSTAEGVEKEIKTEGDRWAYFQVKNFKQVTQPLYVILSPDEKLMNHPVGYTPNVNEYKNWLECGLDAGRRPIADSNE
jgi:thiol:disulfide interchange protein